MNTLTTTERATAKDLLATFKQLNPMDKERLICIGFGMTVASGLGNGLADGLHEDKAKGNA